MLTVKEQRIHESLRQACNGYRASIEEIVVTLLDVARLQFFKKWGRRNLVEYIVEDLRIDSTFTFDLNRVVRAALAHPELEKALRNNEISVGKATRILGTLNAGNSKEVIAYASTHTFAETNSFVAENGSAVTTRERCKQLSADQYRVTLVITAEQFKNLQRTQSLEAQKQKPAKMSDAIGVALSTHPWRHDPIQKAERAHAKIKAAHAKAMDATFAKKTASSVTPASSEMDESITIQSSALRFETKGPQVINKQVMKLSLKFKKDTAKQTAVHTTGYSRIRLTAVENHTLNLKTGRRCAFLDENGRRCNCDRWLDVHHIVPISVGGTNQISNLTHLCGTHHGLVHQLGLPPDGQITWWRAGANP